MKRIIIFLISIIVVLSGCAKNNVADSGEAAVLSEHSDILRDGLDLAYSVRDLEQDFNKDAAVRINLNEDSATIKGEGAKMTKDDGGCNVLKITADKAYIISGKLTNGYILVDLGREGKAELLLDGVDITSVSEPPLYIRKADKVFVTLAENSKNVLTDASGESAGTSNMIGSKIDGAVFCMADLTFKGKGSLTVNTPSRSGIVSKDDLLITGGTYDITALNDGLQARDRVKVFDGNIKINAGDNGIIANNTDSNILGYVAIEGGKFDIEAEHDAIQAHTIIRIAGGDFDITTGGGYKEEIYDGLPRNEYTIEEQGSAKGLKAGSLVYFGEFSNPVTMNMNTADDAINSHNDVEINGGTFNIKTGDHGIHSDADVMINDGEFDIGKCYGGIEGSTVTITGGNLDITSEDDALNSSGGNDASTLDGRPGQDEFHPQQGVYIKLKGGYMTFDTKGDCIDSNGAVYAEGGTVLASVSSNDANSGLEANGTISMLGGTIIVCGMTDMAETYDGSATHNTLQIYLNRKYKAGTNIALTDENSKIIASFTPKHDFSTVIISAEGIEYDKMYRLYEVMAPSNVDANGFVSGKTLAGDNMTKIVETEKISSVLTVTRMK